MAFSIREHLGDRPDPRRPQGVRHRPSDLITIAVRAVVRAADPGADVADVGRAEAGGFATFVGLPHGTPSQDALARVFARLDPDAFERCFVAWSGALAGSSGGKLVAIDGKRIRRSFEHAWDHSTATHLAGAFVAENKAVFGQLAVDGKENEVAAVPGLLELLDPKGATVTADAMGCQAAVAGKVVGAGGDYVPAVTGNQPASHGRVERDARAMLLERFAGTRHGHARTADGDHGRVETRDVWVTDELDWLAAERGRCPGLRSVVVVESTRDLPLKGVSTERRYYIGSHGGVDADAMGVRVRGHWAAGNSLHRALDVSFGEDAARHRKGHSAENFSRPRRTALNLLNRDGSKTRGVKGTRLNAAWEHD